MGGIIISISIIFCNEGTQDFGDARKDAWDPYVGKINKRWQLLLSLGSTNNHPSELIQQGGNEGMNVVLCLLEITCSGKQALGRSSGSPSCVCLNE